MIGKLITEEFVRCDSSYLTKNSDLIPYRVCHICFLIFLLFGAPISIIVKTACIAITSETRFFQPADERRQSLRILVIDLFLVISFSRR